MLTVPARPPSDMSAVGDLYTSSALMKSADNMVISNARVPADEGIAMPFRVTAVNFGSKPAQAHVLTFAVTAGDLHTGNAL